MPLKIGEERVNKDDVYKKIDDAQIFGFYFGPFKFRTTYPSVFRRDRNPSTGFYINKNGRIIYNDIATGEKLDAFAFVGKLHGLDYGEAVRKVALDFGVIKGDRSPLISLESLKKPNQLEEQLKKETTIEITYDKWSYDYLHYWEEYGIEKKELEENDVFPISKLYINHKFIPNFRGNLRFAYILNYKENCYKKIYEPFAEKRYKWFNNTPIYLPYGYDSLRYKTDTLIIQKSQKDRLITLKFHPDCIGIQNESKAALRDSTLDFLKQKYKRIICIFDNDERGIEACKEYTERGCEAYHLPTSLCEKGVKDISDLVKNYGLKNAEKWLMREHII